MSDVLNLCFCVFLKFLKFSPFRGIKARLKVSHELFYFGYFRVFGSEAFSLLIHRPRKV